MLVLSRKVGERVVIADGIIIQVLDIKGQRIRLGIEAPAEVPVWREEICECHRQAAKIVRKPR